MTDGLKPCDLLVTGDLILTLDAASSTLKSRAIAIVGKTIVDIGPADAQRAEWTAAREIDGKGRIVTPGLVNVHNHTRSEGPHASPAARV